MRDIASKQMKNSDLINYCIQNSIPFVSYRLPSENDTTTLAGGCFVSDPEERKHDIRFVIAPFDALSEKTRFYIPEIILAGKESETDKLPNFVNETTQTQTESAPVVSGFNSYINQAEYLIEEMKNDKLQKVVLSRVMEYVPDCQIDPIKLFQNACDRNPKAFVYLFSAAEGSYWLGATPETLLKTEAGKGFTMALAGTQRIDNQLDTEFNWGNKEIHEHEYVSQFIENTLLDCSVENLVRDETKTVSAGKVAHLQTAFNFRIPDNISISEIAQALHPTPAVCGVPTSEARKRILEVEKHKRSLYTGFLGPFIPKESCQLFVNLRCMQIIGDKIYIYVGGGLTAASDPQQEWNETEWKSDTMLSLFEEAGLI
jgi:isochorismate synthase